MNSRNPAENSATRTSTCDHLKEASPMPWWQRKPSHSGINPLTQNLPELDRLISYMQASVILQYRLKRIDKDSNNIKKKKVESIDENIKTNSKGMMSKR